MSPSQLPHHSGQRTSVLLAAASAPWESEAVTSLSAPGTGTWLQKRCLDLADLLGAAATRTAQVAVVSSRLTGLDADSIAHLHREEVSVLAVLDERSAEPPTDLAERLRRMGVDEVVAPDRLGALGELVRGLAARSTQRQSEGTERRARPGAAASLPTDTDQRGSEATGTPGRLVAVWGPPGAPGRTTVAIGIAAELAQRGHRTALVDADPYGGAVAQHLAVLDDVSGLLAASRLANAGQLDAGRLAEAARALGPDLRLLTGLPRPSRWREVRPAAFGELLTVARSLDEVVVVDAGFGIEPGSDDPFDPSPHRDETTRATVLEADVVVAVVAADPVGLQRGARALLDLGDLLPDGPAHVVVNRMRPSLGWDQRDVSDLLLRVAPRARLTFLPDDPKGADRALVSGRTLVESGDSALRRAVAQLTSLVAAELDAGTGATGARRRWRFRRRRRAHTVRSR